MEAAFLIAFREGLEAFLILGLILAFLQKSNLSRFKWIAWSALIAGIVGSIGLAFVFSVLIDGFESEALQFLISLAVLFAAIILLSYMVFWMHHQSHIDNLRKRISLSLNQKSAIFLVIFFAIIREGLETVLFLFAISQEEDAESSQLLTGLVLGLIVSAILVAVILKGSQKLSLKTFFQLSSYLIIFIVAGLSALFVKGLQMGSYLPVLIDPLYDSSALLANDAALGKVLGAFMGYDATPSLLQFFAWSAYIFIFIYLLQRRNHA